jgi:hypothetical protein
MGWGGGRRQGVEEFQPTVTSKAQLCPMGVVKEVKGCEDKFLSRKKK